MTSPDLRVAASPSESDVPVSMSISPQPIRTQIKFLRIDGRTVTSILRNWRPEDIAHCRLCHACDAAHGACNVLVTGTVDPAEAPSFDSRTIPITLRNKEPTPG